MKTVRLTRTLKWDISRAADKKFEAANPTKNYPDAGYEVLVNNKIIENKIKNLNSNNIKTFCIIYLCLN